MMAENNELVLQINKELAIDLPEKISLEDLQNKLAVHINDLIQYHFEQLVSFLYRIDVSEAKIKSLLQQQPNEDAAKIIAALIIERQLQKIKTRQQFSRRDSNFNEEEKW
jgi:hypothetical protein